MADPDDERTLLLVEDEAFVALSEKQTLERYRFAVTAAYSGEEAVRVAEDQHVDLVLMDIDLGNGIDGTEAARRILSARELPVVFLTAHAEQEMVDRVKGITRYGYVLKNSGEFVLVESINMAFELFAARQEAKSHAEYYRLITENSCDMITLFRNLEMEFVSPAVRHLMGYEPEELLSMDHLGLMHPDDRERVAASIAYRIRNRVRESTVYEYRQRVKSGAYRWFESVVNSKRLEESGDVVTVLSTRDITARKEFEERLRESEARFRGFIERSAEGLVLVERDGTVMEWNPAMAELTGLLRDEVIGAPVWEVFSRSVRSAADREETLRRFREQVEHALHTGEGDWLRQPLEQEILRPDDSRRFIERQAFLIPAEGGWRLGSVVRDITARHGA